MYSDERTNYLASPLSCYSSQPDLLFLQDFQLYNQEPMECSLLMGMIWWPLCSILTVWFCIHSPVCLNESHGEMSRLWRYTDMPISVCVCSRRAMLRLAVVKLSNSIFIRKRIIAHSLTYSLRGQTLPLLRNGKLHTSLLYFCDCCKSHFHQHLFWNWVLWMVGSDCLSFHYNIT